MPPKKRSAESTGAEPSSSRPRLSKGKQKAAPEVFSCEEEELDQEASSAPPPQAKKGAKQGARKGPRPAADVAAEHVTVRETVDRTLPSLTHQTSTLLNWSILEQLQVLNETMRENTNLQRFRALMDIEAVAATRPATAMYYMDNFREIGRARAPSSVQGSDAEAAWARLASPNQYLQQAAADLSFAHQRFPPSSSLNVTRDIDQMEQEVLEAVTEAANRATQEDTQSRRHT